MTPGGSGPAVEAIGLVKEFEKGRRTLWQRIRREPDQRERFRAWTLLDPALEWLALEWLALGILSAVLIAVGRVVFRRTEHRMRVRGTLGQH